MAAAGRQRPRGGREREWDRGHEHGREQGRRGRWYEAVVVSLAVVAGTAAGFTGSAPDGRGGARAAGTTSTTSTAGPTDSTGPGESRTPAGHALLVGHEGSGGRLDFLFAVASCPGRQVEVTLVPTATLVEVPSLGAQPLAAVPAAGSADLLEISVENALGVGFDEVVLLDDSALVAVLAPAVRFDVEFRRAIRVDDDAGTFGFRSGTQPVEAGEAVRLLVAPDPGGELEHLVVMQAVLEGWRQALRDTAVAGATVAAEPGLTPLVDAVTAEARYETLPVERVSTGGDERFRLRRDDADRLLARAFDFALLGGEGPRPRVEVLNGTGAIGLAQVVAARIVPAGAEITLTGNVPGFGLTETQVVYYRDENAAAARDLAAALGVGRVMRAGEPIGVVDLTVLVGSDFQPLGAAPPIAPPASATNT